MYIDPFEDLIIYKSEMYLKHKISAKKLVYIYLENVERNDLFIDSFFQLKGDTMKEKADNLAKYYVYGEDY